MSSQPAILRKPPAGAFFLPLLGALMAGTLGAPRAAEPQDVSPAELTTQETQPTFKLQVERNVVLVRVIVRDSRGRPVGDLKKEDFRLWDSGKAQVITHFAVESPSLLPGKSETSTPEETDTEALPESVLAPSAPQNYLGLYFDDVQMPFEDIARVRDAANRYLASSLQAQDRVGVFTSSGQTVLDFTDDHGKLHEALLQLQPRPVVATVPQECPEIDHYQAYLMVERRDAYAISIATEEAFRCNYESPRIPLQEAYARAQMDAERAAVQVLNFSDGKVDYSLRGLEALVRRIALLPGRRNIVFISPGFLSYTQRYRIEEIADRALRANVIVNTFDSKGLFAPIPYGDASKHPVIIPRTELLGRKHQLLLDGITHAAEVLSNLATDTGGAYFHNSNDLDEGFRLVGTLAGVYYTLAFSPQNLRFDGRFHNLKVSLVRPGGLTIQARRGYFAPKKPLDAAAQAKAEIEQALFSQDELQELPVEVHTQFFKFNDTDARLAVLTHLDVRPLHFRKDEGHNLNSLTFATALFDRDGKYLAGNQKLLLLRLADQNLDTLLKSGITMRSSFDLKPGTYLVREVVRDAEGGQISGLNRTVEIPY
jgi:VWFA-related protein